MANHTELDDELVDQLLSELFGQRAVVEVILEVDVEEARYIPERHSSTILILDSSEVSEVNPLYSFSSRVGGTTNIEAIASGHLHDLLQSTDLLSDFFAQTDRVLGHRAMDASEVFLLPSDETISPIES